MLYGDNFVIKGVRREIYDFFEQVKECWGQTLDKEMCVRWSV